MCIRTFVLCPSILILPPAIAADSPRMVQKFTASRCEPLSCSFHHEGQQMGAPAGVYRHGEPALTPPMRIPHGGESNPTLSASRSAPAGLRPNSHMTCPCRLAEASARQPPASRCVAAMPLR